MSYGSAVSHMANLKSFPTPSTQKFGLNRSLTPRFFASFTTNFEKVSFSPHIGSQRASSSFPITKTKTQNDKYVCTVRAEVDSAPQSSSSIKEAATPKRTRPGEHKGFVEEMRIKAMKLHTKDQAKEGQKAAQEKPLGKWEPTKQGYIQFLVDSKAVYDTMESIVEKAIHPLYAEFRNTGLERSARLAKDLEWFQSQGFEIPGPDKFGTEYSQLLEELAEKDPPAFICHFYNVYFAHSAGGRMIGRKVSEMILNNQELEFYKWDGELPELLSAVKDKLNKVSEAWTRDEKDRCLTETEKSFKYSGSILRLLVS